MVEVILPGDGRSLKNQIPGFTANSCAENVENPFATLCIEHDDILLVGFHVLSTPGDVHPNSVGGFDNSDHYAVITQSIGIPIPDSIRNILGG
jgi:hypothetical protein